MAWPYIESWLVVTTRKCGTKIISLRPSKACRSCFNTCRDEPTNTLSRCLVVFMVESETRGGYEY